MAHPVVHWEIAGHDGPALQKFYGELFGWTVDSNNPMNYGMVSPGSGPDGGIFQLDKDDIPPYLTIYIGVDDLQAMLDKAASLGGTTCMPPTPIPGHGSFAMFADPEGHVIGLFKGQ